MRLFIVSLMMLFAGFVFAEYPWKTEVVSPGPGLWEASLALDTSNNPHVSYRLYYVISGRVQYDKMIYSRKNNNVWLNTTFDTNGGAYESLAVDSKGYAHISYYDTPGKTSTYVHWDNTGMTKEIVDRPPNTYLDGLGGFSSLVLDRQDNPHISYMDWTSWNIKYATKNGSNWAITSFPNWPGRTAIALDQAGNPHITAAGKYGYWDGANWQFSTFESAGAIGFASIEIDNNGRPHIAYASDSGVKYAYWNGVQWDIQFIGGGFVNVSLELDSKGIPHIMFGNCQYATLVNGQWITSSLASGYFEDFALDSYDRIHFVYTPDYNSLVYKYQLIPEPATLLLLAVGGLLVRKR